MMKLFNNKIVELEIVLKPLLQQIEDEEKKLTEAERAHATATSAGYQLYNLVNDPHVGMAYTRLLLEKYPNSLSPGSWAETAKISIEHAKLILNNKDIANRLCEKRFLFDIATNRPEHAKLILEKFSDQLDGQLDAVKYFADMKIGYKS